MCTDSPFKIYYDFLTDFFQMLKGRPTSREEIASKELGVSYRTLRNWETTYARGFKLSPEDLMQKTFFRADIDSGKYINAFLDFIEEKGITIPVSFKDRNHRNLYTTSKKEEFKKFFEAFLYNELDELDATTLKHVQAATFFDLVARGFTPLEIAEQLMKNDTNLYSDSAKKEGYIAETVFNESNAGTQTQWAEYLSSWPETFEYLIDSDGKIVGNYSFLSLKEKQYEHFINGELSEKDLKPSETRCLYQPDTAHIMLLLNMSVNHEYNTIDNNMMIRAMFWNKIANYATKGVLFKKIVVNVFRQDHKVYYESFGFVEKGNAKNGSTILELKMIPYPQKLDDMLTNSELYKTSAMLQKAYKITYVQLRQDSILTASQRGDLATLIYNTDPYIYPCLFDDECSARYTLPSLIESQDAMFQKSNYFIAKLNGRIIGMILWHRGPLEWNNNALCNLIKSNELLFPKGFDLACTEYFGEYKNTPENVLSVINVCIYNHLQDCGIGSLLMNRFCEKHSKEKMELFVLDENKAAIRVYEKCGFTIQRTDNGFSPNEPKPLCHKMINYSV